MPVAIAFGDKRYAKKFHKQELKKILKKLAKKNKVKRRRVYNGHEYVYHEFGRKLPTIMHPIMESIREY